MSLQLSATVRNARLDQIESTIGLTALLRFFTGAMPANCATADAGTKIFEQALPSDWMAAASSGAKAKTGTWAGTGHSNAGTGATAGYFRIYDSTGTTCHIQGTITATGAGGDMTLDNTSIASGQSVTISTFTLTDGNA